MYKIEDIINKVHCADCLEFMKQIPDKSVDLVLTDPPYGTTSNEWDNVVDLDLMWKQLNRICKGRKIMFSSQPFTTDLINSNRKEYKHQWIWNKLLGGNSLTVKHAPYKIHEEVIVFGDGNYYPLMTKGRWREKTITGKDKHGTFNFTQGETERKWNDDYYPTSIITYSTASERKEREHPTQKPVEIMAYLIKTYSKEGDIIFDPFLGSGTTALACKMLKRNFIGVEISEKYCEIARTRLSQQQLF